MSNQSSPVYRVEVQSSLDTRVQSIHKQLDLLGVRIVEHLEIRDVYFLEGYLADTQIRLIAERLICDPVTEHYTWRNLSEHRVKLINGEESNIFDLEVALRPGVTDNVAVELLRGAERLGLEALQSVATATRYIFTLSPDVDAEEWLNFLARNLLANQTIHHYSLGEIQPVFVHPETVVHPPEILPLRQSGEADLLKLSQERRLALDLPEMRAVQDYFLREGRDPTDAELEMIAQTWSEHCVHKTFKALIHIRTGEMDYPPAADVGASILEDTLVDGLLKTYLRAATDRINAPWVRSAFVDNAGVIAFDDVYDISFKVETHNHPSAIEPFGGANTGVGGVVRDVLGVSHRPIVTTDVLCFGTPDAPAGDIPDGVLHPRRIRAGVVAGVEDYGNKLGLATVNGAVIYHPGYTANPLVYCGCVGIGPVNSHPRTPRLGDRIIVIGGRTGRDGLRGATFSSLAMDAQTGEVAGASVQIGDPITEKGVIEVVVRARDARLYHAITDCGAGGLSSAVGEMGSAGGASVDLAHVPLKYAGLQPWEIWLSEAQERMVLAVPPENIPALAEICQTYWVEWCDIGEFQDTGRLVVLHGDMQVVDLDNHFLHEGIPRLHLDALLPVQAMHFQDAQVSEYPRPSLASEFSALHSPEANLLLALLSHPNIASKENIIRVYDHIVRGATWVAPLVGQFNDGPSDAAVLKPLETEGWQGFVLANGVNPYLGILDPYAMAISVVDEAIRNAVAVGADPARIAILDNFCWGSPRRPETLGTLLETARGCYDAAVHYGTPYISGKDSLNNEYLGSDGERHAIPGTLLISSIGIHPDVRTAVTMDLKAPGNLVYLVGDWAPVLGGSHAWMIGGGDFFGEQSLKAPRISPKAPLLYRRIHEAIQSSMIRSAHDLSEGGLAVAVAEMVLAGRQGLEIDIAVLCRGLSSPFAHSAHSAVETRRLALFGETNGCLLVEVEPNKAANFETLLEGLPTWKIGQTAEAPRLIIRVLDASILDLPVNLLVEAFTNQGGA